jgi:cupin fold WbuC family metalloprotein
MREMSPAVIQMQGTTVVVDADLIRTIIERARLAPERRARALLHPSASDSLHEMVIALPRDSCDVPHINFKSGKSFHVIEGELVVMIFSDDGRETTAIPLSAVDTRHGRMLRLVTSKWHTIIPLTEYTVFIETIIGPFTGNQFAPWVHPKGTIGWDSFVSELRSIATSARDASVEALLACTNTETPNR